MNFFWEKIKVFQKDILAFFIIAAGILLMYGRSAGYGGDIWDDSFYLALFPADSSLSHLFTQLQKPVLGLYSPLVTLSFYLDRLLFYSGDPVFSAHIWNLFYFTLGTWGLYRLFRELSFPGREGPRWELGVRFAAAGALLWAFHPQRVESVVWIAERKDVLLACCAWWAWALFIRGFRKGVFSYGAFVLFLLSFGIKPMLILFPGMLALWIFFETGSKNLRDYRFLLPWCAVSCVFFVQGLFNVSGSGGAGPGRFEVLLWNCGNYAVTAFLPIGTGPFHPFYPEPGWGNFYILLSSLALYFLCFLLLPQYRKTVLLPLLWAMVGAAFLLAPASGVVRIGNADWADRYNLLPSAMAALVLCAVTSRVWQSPGKLFKAGGIACFGGLFLWNAAACSMQIPVWKSGATVMKEALSQTVPNYRVLFLAAVEALEQGKEKEFYQLTERLPREEQLTPFDAGTVRIFRMATDAQWSFRKKQSAEGVKKVELLLADPAWRRITAISDGFPQQLLSQAAEYYLNCNRQDLAAVVFERVGLCYPGDMEEYFYRGLALIFQRKYAEAVIELEKAAELAPRDTAVRYQLEFARRHAGTK